MSSSPKPFGMLFEEFTLVPANAFVMPEYDITKSLSFVVDPTGKRIPFISQDWKMASTGTVTNVSAETTDSDQRQEILTTQTATKVMMEGSDDDVSSQMVSTATETRVKAESGDDDINHFYFTLATQTISEVKAESTDAD